MILINYAKLAIFFAAEYRTLEKTKMKFIFSQITVTAWSFFHFVNINRINGTGTPTEVRNDGSSKRRKFEQFELPSFELPSPLASGDGTSKLLIYYICSNYCYCDIT